MVFMSGMVTLSSRKLSSNIWISLWMKADFRATEPFISERYLNSVLELAFNVDSVRPPELVTRPLNMLKL